MFEEVIDVVTEDGKMNTYIYRPDEGGPFPVVLFFMDAAGVREALADMCRRLASAGYFVAMPNLFYRKARYVDINVDRFATDPAYGETTDLLWSLNNHLTNSMVMRDTAALLSRLDADRMARPGKIGLLGYCMSGKFVYRGAADFADRVAAAVAMYGNPLVSDAPDSAHLTTGKISGEIYFGFAEQEVFYSAVDMMGELETYFTPTKVRYRLELYRGREHGFALPGRRTYHKNSSERHWIRVYDIFSRNLRQ